MRWQLVLQLSAGLAALFGFGYFTSARYVDGPGEEISRRTASAQAVAVASNIAVEWERARVAHRSLVEAAAASPVIASLGGSVTNAEARQGAIKSALEGASALAGGRGEAALISPRGQSLASIGEQGTRLADADAVKDAMSGASSVRLQLVGGDARIVAAAPIFGEDGSIQGVLAISSALDDQRIGVWNGAGPIGTGVALATKDEVVASTVRDRRGTRPDAKNIKNEVTIEGRKYVVVPRELSDDAGASIRVFGMALANDGLSDRLVTRVRFLVVALGVFAMLIVLFGVMLSPAPQAKIVAHAHVTPTEEGDDTIIGATVPPVHVHDVDTFGQEPTLEPRIISQSIPPKAGKAEGPPVSPFSATLADTALRAGIEGLPLSANPPSERSEAFDEIAAVAFSQPPRKDEEREMPGMVVGPDEDLPMPVEHLQLPALREPMGQRSAPQPSQPFPNRDRGAPARTPAQSQPQPQPQVPDRRQLTSSESPTRPGAQSPLQPSRSSPMAQPAPQPQPQRVSQPQQPMQPQRGPMYGGSPSAVPLPPSQAERTLPMNMPARAQQPQHAQADDPWRNHAAGGIANATTQPMQVPSSEPRRFTTTGDLERGNLQVGGGNGIKESSSSPPLASARPYPSQPSQAPQHGGTPLPQGGTPLPHAQPHREVPMPFDEEHYRYVYNEFVGSKARLGEAVDNITFEGFSSKLRTSEKELIDRHGCRAVRFQVLVKDRQVSLRPQLVR